VRTQSGKSMLLKRKKDRTRKAILDGIYQDNQYVFNNKPPALRRHWRFARLVQPIAILTFAIPLLVFANIQLLDTQATSAYQSAGPLAGQDLKTGLTTIWSSTWKDPKKISLKHIHTWLFAENTQPPKPIVVAPSNLSLNQTWLSSSPSSSNGAMFSRSASTNTVAKNNENNFTEEWLTHLRGGFFQGDDTPLIRKMFGLGIKIIVIDPGHGGHDPGTSGKNGLHEKTVVLDIARRLKKKLEAQGDYRVVLTRDEDVKLSLNERVECANTLQADLFISIHVNYLPSRPNNLIETYYFGMSEDKAVMQRAAHQNADSDVSISEFSHMMERLEGTLKLQESKRLASEIQRSLMANVGKDDKTIIDLGIKEAPFLVIMGTEMPAVLAEVTSLSNEDEAAKLHTAEYRENIAIYLESGITSYLNKGDYVYESKR